MGGLVRLEALYAQPPAGEVAAPRRRSCSGAKATASPRRNTGAGWRPGCRTPGSGRSRPPATIPISNRPARLPRRSRPFWRAHDAGPAFQRNGLPPGLGGAARGPAQCDPEPGLRSRNRRRPLSPLSRQMGALRPARPQHHGERAPCDGDLHHIALHHYDGNSGARDAQRPVALPRHADRQPHGRRPRCGGIRHAGRHQPGGASRSGS